MLNVLGQQIFRDRYAITEEETFEEAAERIASVADDAFREGIKKKIVQGKLVPAGRIWRSVGTDTLTGYNCYVLPSPHDSRGGVVETLKNQIEIMSRGGGVGINLATLRPTGAKVFGVAGKSSGPVSWGEIYAFATGLIEQGGSRRGALMLTLPIWHPSVVEFITAKKDNNRLLNANLSVLVSDHFMEAVQEKDDWQFVFPDTTDPLYDTTWDGDIYNYKGSILSHGSMPAVELWDLIAESAWASAEPGVIFWDTVEKTFAGRWDGTKPVCVNPCSEQPLPANGVCNLAHVNLSEMFDDEKREFDWREFDMTVKYAVILLNRIIDTTNAVLPEVQKQQEQERRIGIGVLGLHDLLIKMKIVYGSYRSLEFIEDLFKHMYLSAVEMSVMEAAIFGAYPAFNKEAFLETREFDLIAKYSHSLAEQVRTYGLRNSSLLTIAPTGTVGTMLDVSTGIEPHFAFEYKRNSRLGTFTVRPKIAQGVEIEGNLLYVTAQELSPIGHLRVLIAAQKYVDSSISKTVNLPATATVEDVKSLYRAAWVNGVKGITVYRDGSRSEQILENVEPKRNTRICEECGGEMVYQEGCATCTNCGASFCTI